MNIKMKKCFIQTSDMQVLIEKSLNANNEQLELEVTIRRKDPDTTLKLEKSVPYK